MTLILPTDHTLEQTGDTLVQLAPKVRWINQSQAEGTVQVATERPTLGQWTAWVDQAGGQWTNDQDLASL